MCDVIFEDNQVLVAVKPQNVPVQLDSSEDKDFLTMLKDYLIKEHNKQGNAFLGLVHRLDRPTGGVMVFAKNSKSAERLSKQIQDRSVEKIYFAVLNGVPKNRQGTLKNYLKKDERTNTVKICPQYEDGAKEAVLNYQVLETKNGRALVKIALETGRSHQIRVQFAGINCPVVNDQKYGNQNEKGNLALWATEIKFDHPVTKVRHTFRVPPPYDEGAWKDFNVARFLLV